MKDLLQEDDVSFNDEGMDIIEILWKQDLDMGVSREAFDTRFRREQEHQEVYDDLEAKLKESLASDILLSAEVGMPSHPMETDPLTYILDGETGELVPEQQNSDLLTKCTEKNPKKSKTSDVNAFNSKMLQIALNALEMDLESTSRKIYMPSQVSPEDNTSVVENIPSSPSVSYSRQNSLEARWSDVEGFINTDSQTETISKMGNFGAAPISFENVMTTHPTMNNYNKDIQEKITQPQSLQLSTRGQDESFNLTHSLGVANDYFQHTTQENIPVYNNPDCMLSKIHTHGNQESEEIFHEIAHPQENGYYGNTIYNTGSNAIPIKTEYDDLHISYESDRSHFQDGHAYQNSTASRFDNYSRMNSPEGPIADLSEDHFQRNYTYSNYHHPHSSYYNGNNTSDLDAQPSDLSYSAHMSHSGHDYSWIEEYRPKCNRKTKGEMHKSLSKSKDEDKAKDLNIPFTIQEIIETPVEAFNDLLSKYKLSETQLQLIKDIRRRGKNKVAAQNCRKRKFEMIETLEESVTRMRKEKEEETLIKSKLQCERDKMRQKCQKLYNKIFSTLKDEHGKPFDSEKYKLQHTPDGSVLLVPVKEHSKKPGCQFLDDIKSWKAHKKFHSFGVVC